MPTDRTRLTAFAIPFVHSPGRLALHSLLALAALALVACGGSGGDSPTSPQVLSVSSVEDQSFQLINSARNQEGVAQVTFDSQLSDVAREHSEMMRDQGFFGHTDPNGNGLRKRLKAHGIAFSSAGENLALVNDSSNPAGLAHQQLLASPTHRDVMLAGKFARAGVGVARAGSNFWITQVYVKP